jgi:SAM-dependent methyltransferase
MPSSKNDYQSLLRHESQEISSKVIDPDSVISAWVAIKWQGDDCQYTDWRYFPTIELARDLMPAEILTQLTGKTKGEQIQHEFDAGALVPVHQQEMHQIMAKECFQPPVHAPKGPGPLLGRFYPQDYFHNAPAICRGSNQPCRVTNVKENRITVDCNHPLAKKKLKMIFDIESIRKNGLEREQRCVDIVTQLCDMGPGMQDIAGNDETEFFCTHSFDRKDTKDDGIYFQSARLTPYWDTNASAQVSHFYRNHINPGSTILDLMAGVHSPLLEAGIDGIDVTAAGLNAEELDNNKSCKCRIVLDVNRISALPFNDAAFDVVLIHAAIEYVTKPRLLFAEINRILKPAGRIIVSFSNRNEADKVIRIWAELSEFERSGLVLAYLRAGTQLEHFQSFTSRGRYRTKEEALTDQLLYSDPVFIVMGHKIACITN